MALHVSNTENTVGRINMSNTENTAGRINVSNTVNTLAVARKNIFPETVHLPSDKITPVNVALSLTSELFVVFPILSDIYLPSLHEVSLLEEQVCFLIIFPSLLVHKTYIVCILICNCI